MIVEDLWILSWSQLVLWSLTLLEARGIRASPLELLPSQVLEPATMLKAALRFWQVQVRPGTGGISQLRETCRGKREKKDSS